MSSIYSKLRRTVINEGELYKLRRLVSESNSDYDNESGLLKLRNRCLDSLSKGSIELDEPEKQSFYGWISEPEEKVKHQQELESDVYCRLYQLSQNLPSDLSERLHIDVSHIYNFLSMGLRVDNRRKFHSLMKKILDHDNPANSINLVSEFIRNTEDVDVVKRTIDRFRKKSIGESGLEDFLKTAKFSEYTRYENSFVGSHFERNPTFLRLKYRTEEDNRSIIDRVFSIMNGDTKISTVVSQLYDAIRNNYSPINMIKSDLLCKKPFFDERGNTVIRQGEFVEVKKLDYQADSYLSEFFAIYKKKDLPSIVYGDEFLSIYNKIIDGLFIAFDSSGRDMLEDIKTDFAGIIYDNNYFIKDEDITFYWSNKGRSTCKEHRLSIRYKINKDVVNGYVLNDSGVLTTKKLNIRVKEDFILCPIGRFKN